jgi:hypothetical protein
MPVNPPTHGHGQGYSDLNFLIPELVSGIQFAKGPYFADQGDFANAGSANINYVSMLEKTCSKSNGRGRGFRASVGRGLAHGGAGSTTCGVRGGAQRRSLGAAGRFQEAERRRSIGTRGFEP